MKPGKTHLCFVRHFLWNYVSKNQILRIETGLHRKYLAETFIPTGPGWQGYWQSLVLLLGAWLFPPLPKEHLPSTLLLAVNKEFLPVLYWSQGCSWAQNKVRQPRCPGEGYETSHCTARHGWHQCWWWVISLSLVARNDSTPRAPLMTLLWLAVTLTAT